MRTRYKYHSTLPYSLHDMTVECIECKENTLVFYFSHGYSRTVEPYLQVEGHLEIEEVDLDFCDVWLMSRDGNYGKFEGKKLSLLEFIETHPNPLFEIVDEMVGYNSVVYRGFLTVPHENSWIEMTLSIYHTGDIIFDTEE